MSPSSARGERTPPALSTSPIAACRRASSSSRDEVGDRERRRARAAAAAIGGAIGDRAASGARGQTASGRLAGRGREHVGVGRPLARARTTAPACGRRPSSPALAQARAIAAAAPGLADLGAGAGDDQRRARVIATCRSRLPVTAWRARAASVVDLLRRCARPTARRAAARSRGATVGGRIAGTSSPRSSSAAAAASARCLVAAHDRHDRRRMAGPEPVDVRAQARDAARRPRRTATTPQRRERGRGVGRRRRGREDVGAGAVLDRARRSARRPGDEAAERAERLRQRADAQHVDAVEVDVEVGPEHRVGLVEHEQRAVRGAHSSTSASTVGDVAVHREHGVGDDERARRSPRGRGAARRGGRGRGGGRRRRRRARGGSRR